MIKVFLIIIAGGLMGATVASAIPSSGLMTVNGSPLEYDYGGQFTASVAGYAPFQTYCIEIQHDFSLGETVDYTLGQTTHGAPPNTAAPFLNAGAAWLFSQFNSGGLGALTPATPTQAGELQAALWYFQGQGTPDSAYSGPGFGYGLPGADAYTDLADSVLGASFINPLAPIAGSFGVDVIQSSHLSGGPAQDWLYAGPVPDGGMTAGLLGSALIGVQLLRRKLVS